MKSVTYKKVSKGLKPLRRNLDIYTKKYRAYQNRLDKFVFWWNDHVISCDGILAGSVIKYKRENYICTASRIDHDNFRIEIDIKPVSSIGGIGDNSAIYETITF